MSKWELTWLNFTIFANLIQPRFIWWESLNKWVSLLGWLMGGCVTWCRRSSILWAAPFPREGVLKGIKLEKSKNKAEHKQTTLHAFISLCSWLKIGYDQLSKVSALIFPPWWISTWNCKLQLIPSFSKLLLVGIFF